MRLFTVFVSSAFVLAGTSTALPVERDMLVARFADSDFLSEIEARAYDKEPGQLYAHGGVANDKSLSRHRRSFYEPPRYEFTRRRAEVRPAITGMISSLVLRSESRGPPYDPSSPLSPNNLPPAPAGGHTLRLHPSPPPAPAGSQTLQLHPSPPPAPAGGQTLPLPPSPNNLPPSQDSQTPHVHSLPHPPLRHPAFFGDQPPAPTGRQFLQLSSPGLPTAPHGPPPSQDSQPPHVHSPPHPPLRHPAFFGDQPPAPTGRRFLQLSSPGLPTAPHGPPPSQDSQPPHVHSPPPLRHSDIFNDQPQPPAGGHPLQLSSPGPPPAPRGPQTADPRAPRRRPR